MAAFRRAKRDWEINRAGTPVRMAINDMRSVCQQTGDNGYTEKCKRKKIEIRKKLGGRGRENKDNYF